MINIYLLITKLFTTRLALAAFEVSSSFEPHITKPDIFQVFGVSEYPPFVFLKSYLSQFTFLKLLSLTNLMVTVLLIIFATILLGLVLKMLSYAKKNVKFLQKLRLIPLVLKQNSFDYFQNYCQRDKDGVYYCSYSDHKSYHRFSRFTLGGSLIAFILKVVLTIIIISVQGGIIQAFSGREGSNFNIFIDTFTSGGGKLASTNYTMESSFGEGLVGTASSTNYQENAGFTSIDDEPSIGFRVTSMPVSFGLLNQLSAAYSSHSFTAFYNGDRGYDIYIQSDPLSVPGTNAVLQAIGHTPTSSQPGVEQFGINLRANSSPVAFGANAIGGVAQPTDSYNNQNQYAFNRGDIIAGSDGRSPTTTFTTSVIVNISNVTPAGDYSGSLIYVLVPRF